MGGVRGKYVSSNFVSFGFAWKELKKKGWKAVRPRARDLDPKWKYVRPDGDPNGTKGVDFFLGEEEILEYYDRDAAIAKAVLPLTVAVFSKHIQSPFKFGHSSQEDTKATHHQAEAGGSAHTKCKKDLGCKRLVSLRSSKRIMVLLILGMRPLWDDMITDVDSDVDDAVSDLTAEDGSEVNDEQDAVEIELAKEFVDTFRDTLRPCD
ncbi:hypothetical protein PHMEG_00021202 [Phytophthora megakarya]|uniref:Uncharacterized protein n=1 Tax=Phytophthora megakarya TaxID=4795 RepID=A0A225VM78_9STRA|nr:hypothetical protein PHMEG_00021202 [Phytophthora megakarya]